MIPSYPKRLIEVDLPIKRISAHARREKSIRHGHISTLHIWWARRPLAACRAVICAALWPDPADPICPETFRASAREQMEKWASDHLKLCAEESGRHFVAIQKDLNLLKDNMILRRAMLDFIADFANWDNSTVKEYLDTSRVLTQAAHDALGGPSGTRPLVVDPFAGGGSIPLEALRVGADAFASDLNPVPVLLNKVVLEYIPKYGRRLADEVRKWGDWIKREAEKELSDFYPKDADGSTSIAYLWARTIRCEGPGCGAEIPLIRSLCIARRGSKLVCLRILPKPREKRVDFEIIESAKPSEVGRGTVRRSSATCPCCGYTTPAERVRNQFKERSGGAADARMFAVILSSPDRSGRRYRIPCQNDVEVAKIAKARLFELSEDPQERDARFPIEKLPYLRSIFNINLLDVNHWKDLFSPRQLMALSCFNRLVPEVRSKIGDKYGSDLADAVVTCLALVVGREADKLSSLARWDVSRENAQGTFGRQALGIVWDFNEVNPFSGSGGDWDTALNWVALVLERESSSFKSIGHAESASATEYPLPDDSAAVFFTDPPYYDAVPYADLSDFFYVWLKRSLAKVHPHLFGDELTPKKLEVVQLAERNPIYAFKTKENFEDLMCKSLVEGRRVTQPPGLGVVVFAHKTTNAWEVMLQAVIDAGWIIVASWPIDTEMENRLRAMNSATLTSSVHLVCRPRENPDGSVRADEIGDWRDVLQELPRRIHEWMPRLAEEGVVGADAIFACLGPALEVYSRYSRVEKASGETVKLKEYLEQVWAAVAKEALSLVFRGADVSGFEEDARLTAMWLWTLFAGTGAAQSAIDDEDFEEADPEEEGIATSKGKVTGFALEYDAARKIAQGLGAHLEDLTSLVEIKGDTARLLPVAERTRALFGKDDAQAPSTSKMKKEAQQKLLFEAELQEAEESGGWGQKGVPRVGNTVLDRVHQAMILFAAGRGEALRRFLVDEGVGRDERFWRLAQALSALYPSGTDERRWVEGVQARKKGLGL